MFFNQVKYSLINNITDIILFIIIPYIICTIFYLFHKKDILNKFILFIPILNSIVSFYILISFFKEQSLSIINLLRKKLKKIIINKTLKHYKISIKDIDPYNEEDWSDLINNKILKLLL
jgi:hypothetical protein